jgi:hypothetical protein
LIGQESPGKGKDHLQYLTQEYLNLSSFSMKFRNNAFLFRFLHGGGRTNPETEIKKGKPVKEKVIKTDLPLK